MGRLRDRLYRWRIRRGLERAYGRADHETAELGELRAVVFSDHHRGRLDRADDFERCEAAYRAALGWYAEQGFALWLLGDVEELWENRPEAVLRSYREVLELERSFGGRLWRFFGNHDMAWRREHNVATYLRAHLPAGVGVREAVRLRLRDGGRDAGALFLEHRLVVAEAQPDVVARLRPLGTSWPARAPTATTATARRTSRRRATSTPAAARSATAT